LNSAAFTLALAPQHSKLLNELKIIAQQQKGVRSMKFVTIQQVPRNPAEGIVLDVRTPGEHADLHLQRAHDHVPLDTLDPSDFAARRGLDKDAAIYILCRGGSRAQTAAQKFIDEGFINIYVIEGGIVAAEAEGEPVVKGHEGSSHAGISAPAIDINKAKAQALGMRDNFYGRMGKYTYERQLDLIIGATLVLTMMLGIADAEFFFIFPLLIGAGLFYRGLTGKCVGLKLLSKAPWNKNKMDPAI
jgi:rhodanese-related sulfurtransferase